MKKHISLIIALLCVILVINVSGCKTIDGKNEYPVIIGHTSIFEKPQKILILNDSIADIIMTGGYIEQVVGRSDDCSQADLRVIPSVGSKSNPDVEKIISLGTQIVIADETLSEEAKQSLKEAEIKVLPMVSAKNREELTTLYTNISAVFMGSITGKEKGVKKAENLFVTIDDMTRQIPDPTIINTCCYIFDLSSENCEVVTGDMFASNFMSYIKCVNIASGAVKGSLSLDNLVMQNPKYIFCDIGVAEKLTSNPKTKELSAVKNNQVFEMSREAVTRQGLTILSTIKTMAAKVYPELFTESVDTDLDINSSITNDSDVTTKKYMVSNDTGLNLREAPIDGNIILVLDYGTELEVIDDSFDGWYKVKLTDGTVGYCSREFISEVSY